MPFKLHRLLVVRWPSKPTSGSAPAKQPEMGEEPDVTPEEASYVFTAPSHGDGHRFKVSVWLWRRSTTGSLVFRPWKELREDKDHSIKDYVRDIVRRSLRRHSVFDAAQAEESANVAVETWLANLPADSVAGRWRAVIEVEVPDEVRKLRCAHESEIYKIRTRAEQIALRVDKLRVSRVICEDFLKEAMESSTARHAVRLTQDLDNVADITDQMLAERREKAEQLFKLFTKIVDAQRHANAFELVLASESALRAAFERLDVPLPPPDPNSPFAFTEESG
ncbi:hypothetical protein Aple_017800 [Acrocarpospora pleiomorpha]|uniref:Uncharacterized protein n=1 Tax=Acrocarpospora pleiomorpha TaxID=90975 RepID=A0A5M3XB24_9ACTN|nr:hypothetical protein [Acrocarpospora pleiomorpha]GES18885.1 hypothetical protein Aple_017800 [Acrocarpospora pleiomorpha]